MSRQQLQQLALIKRQRISQLTAVYNNNISALTSAYNSGRLSILRNRLMALRSKNALLSQLYNKFVSDKNNLYNQYKISVASVNALTVNDLFPPNPSPNLTQQQLAQPLKKSALLIGINYIGTNNQLSGCINDVESINQLLQTYKYDNITMLTDNTTIKPTKTNILTSLKNLFINAKDGDTLYIHYSGHGTNTSDSNRDESDGRDELIIPLDFNLIVDDELRECINTNLTVNANVLAVFDCCYSGTVLDLKYLYQSDNNNNFSQNLNHSDTKSNIVLISGCRDDQLSSEAYTDKKIEGAMSWTIKNVITEKGSNISWKTLISSMRDILINSGFDQVPQLSTGKPINIDSKMFI
jgi:hypothetical protein